MVMCNDRRHDDRITRVLRRYGVVVAYLGLHVVEDGLMKIPIASEKLRSCLTCVESRIIADGFAARERLYCDRGGAQSSFELRHGRENCFALWLAR
jgi:hypothetical protein